MAHAVHAKNKGYCKLLHPELKAQPAVQEVMVFRA